jgi:autoinducer 2-degrading protein
MYIVHVHIRVKSDCVEAFKTASMENARNSLLEPGIARFDILQEINDPTHFELIEVYRTSEDPVKHKETEHYTKWRKLVEPMLVEPRTRTQYSNLFPNDEEW